MQAASGRNILAPMPDQVTELLCDLATEVSAMLDCRCTYVCFDQHHQLLCAVQVAPRTLGCMPMEVSSSQFLFVLFVKDAQAAATHFIADLTAEVMHSRDHHHQACQASDSNSETTVSLA